MYLPEDGHIGGRNMHKVYGVYKIFSHTAVHLLDLISHLTVQYKAWII
jgi:hypothetical protein